MKADDAKVFSETPVKLYMDLIELLQTLATQVQKLTQGLKKILKPGEN